MSANARSKLPCCWNMVVILTQWFLQGLLAWSLLLILAYFFSIFFQRRSLSRSDNHVSTPEFRNYAAHAAHGPSRVKGRVQPCSSAAVQHAAKYQFQRPGFLIFSQQRHATAGQLSSSCSWVLDVDVFLFWTCKVQVSTCFNRLGRWLKDNFISGGPDSSELPSGVSYRSRRERFFGRQAERGHASEQLKTYMYHQLI